MFHFAALIAATVLLSGCAWTTHNLDLKTNVHLAQNTIGKGTRVSFHFLDDRNSTTVGHRSVGNVGAKVKSGNVVNLVEQSLKDGLTNKGYELVKSDADANAVLTYKLRAFDFNIEMGFFTGGENTGAVISAEALKNNQTYSKIYRYQNENRIVFIPGGDSINEQMNQALNAVLQKANDDSQLDVFLTDHTGQ